MRKRVEEEEETSEEEAPEMTVLDVLTPEARAAFEAAQVGACPLCGVQEPHRHCRNCYDVLDVADTRGHQMQSGVFSCSPAEPAEVRGAV